MKTANLDLTTQEDVILEDVKTLLEIAAKLNYERWETLPNDCEHSKQISTLLHSAIARLNEVEDILYNDLDKK